MDGSLTPPTNKTPGKITAEELAAARAYRVATTPNLLALETFVKTVLEAASDMPPEDAASYLERQAKHIARKLHRLAEYAASPLDIECPEDLAGLDFFDLANARDRLSSAAGRYAERKVA